MIGLAEKLGYSTGAQISYIESGKRSMSRNKIIKFCQLFNKPIEELLFEIPNNKKELKSLMILLKSRNVFMRNNFSILY